MMVIGHGHGGRGHSGQGIAIARAMERAKDFSLRLSLGI